MEDKIKLLIDDYKRKVNSVTYMLNQKTGFINDSTYHRLIGKKEVYKSIIIELENIINHEH